MSWRYAQWYYLHSREESSGKINLTKNYLFTVLLDKEQHHNLKEWSNYMNISMAEITRGLIKDRGFFEPLVTLRGKGN